MSQGNHRSLMISLSWTLSFCQELWIRCEENCRWDQHFFESPWTGWDLGRCNDAMNQGRFPFNVTYPDMNGTTTTTTKYSPEQILGCNSWIIPWTIRLDILRWWGHTRISCISGIIENISVFNAHFLTLTPISFVEGILVALRFLFKRRGLSSAKGHLRMWMILEWTCQRLALWEFAPWLRPSDFELPSEVVEAYKTAVYLCESWVLPFITEQILDEHFKGEAVKCDNMQHELFNSSWMCWFMWLQLALGLLSLFSGFLFVFQSTVLWILRSFEIYAILLFGFAWHRGRQEILPLGPPVPDPLLPDAPLTPAPFPGGRGASLIDKSKKTMRLGLNDKSLWQLYLWSMKPSKSI